MGERDDTYLLAQNLSPEGELLTHGHGERGRVVDGEVQPGEDGDHDGHWGGSPWPSFFLGDGAAMEGPLPSLMASWEEEFS